MSADLAWITALIRGRRSTKPAALDSSRPVPRALVEQLLENACWAPTHGMTEPWRFKVYEGAARERLCAELPKIYDTVTPPHQVRIEKREKLGVVFRLAPVVIAVCMARGTNIKIPEIEEIMAVACAVQNLHLSATAAGLTGMWSTPPLVYTEAVKPLLDLRDDERCLGFFFLGWPAQITPPQSRRTALEQKVSWIEG
ncbi:MAG: nitroreductase family protein [Verrucomicrobiales bacterium]